MILAWAGPGIQGAAYIHSYSELEVEGKWQVTIKAHLDIPHFALRAAGTMFALRLLSDVNDVDFDRMRQDARRYRFVESHSSGGYTQSIDGKVTEVQYHIVEFERDLD